MNRFSKSFKITLLILAIAFGLGLFLADRDATVVNAAGQQGDKYWTSSVSPWNSTYGAAAFPMDPNAQAVVTYLQVRAHAGGYVDFYQRAGAVSGTSTYALIVADSASNSSGFCGGTTTYIHVASGQAIVPAGGGVYVVVDDGAGVCGWGEVASATNAGSIALTSGESNFSTGPLGAPYAGNGDLSGVTFPVNSRVYPMERIARIESSEATTTLDSNTGIYAFTTGSPGMVMTHENSESGSSVFGITVEYK
ncbi:MAG: hypothetical protein JRJ54_07195 [Deltaproteobacteria bacterium]|nr:hypothetical protein [Deltaproteobacteria bacterium]